MAKLARMQNLNVEAEHIVFTSAVHTTSALEDKAKAMTGSIKGRMMKDYTLKTFNIPGQYIALVEAETITVNCEDIEEEPNSKFGHVTIGCEKCSISEAVKTFQKGHELGRTINRICTFTPQTV